MVRKPKNIFLHFLNKDTQEIFGLRGEWDPYIHGLIKKGLNASVLLCADETYCFLPLGFWFESDYTRKLLIEAGECIKSGYIRFSAREESIHEFIEKKREQYGQFRNSGETWSIYKNFFDEGILQQLLDLHPYLMDRSTKIGQYCSGLWTEEHNQLIIDNTGNLHSIYSRIQDLDDWKRITKAVCSVAEDIENPFVWTKVLSKISELAIKDTRIKKELRIYFEKNYYAIYLNEYNATYLYNFYPIDKKIDFHFGKASDTVADFRWFEIFLDLLGLGKLFDAPGWKIVLVKKSRDWAKLMQNYINICNQYLDGSITFEVICVEASDNPEAAAAASRIRGILNMKEERIYSEIPEDVGSAENENRKSEIDVLIMVATMEEERAIRNNEEWESRKFPDGYEYFVRKEGLCFALARMIDMGMENAFCAQYFFNMLKPRYLAMAGFCAGNRGRVNLGDVIVPFKIYQYDVGKQLSETEMLPEINMFRIQNQWKQKIERFGTEWRSSISLLRPITYESQRYLFLKMMVEQEYKVTIEDLKKDHRLPDITSILKEDLNDNLLKIQGKFAVATKLGREKYNLDYQINYAGEYQDPEPEVKVGVLATGTRVQQYKEIFQKLEKAYDRKTCALDMEGYAIADIANFNSVPYLIAKGVGDFANDGKSFDNRYIGYAVFSAYRFLVAFFNGLDS